MMSYEGFDKFSGQINGELKTAIDPSKQAVTAEFRKTLYDVMKSVFGQDGTFGVMDGAEYKIKKNQWDEIYAAAKSVLLPPWNSDCKNHFDNLQGGGGQFKVALALHYWFHTSADEDCSEYLQGKLSLKEKAEELDRVLLQGKTFYERFGKTVGVSSQVDSKKSSSNISSPNLPLSTFQSLSSEEKIPTAQFLTDFRWQGMSVPPPKPDEKWELLKQIKPARFYLTKHSNLIFDLLGNLLLQFFIQKNPFIDRIYWSDDNILAGVRWDSGGDIVPRRILTSYAKSTDKTFRQIHTFSSRSFLTNFEPVNFKSNDIIMTNTFCASYWDNKNLYVYELGVDGESIRHSSYQNKPSNIWRKFKTGTSSSGFLISECDPVIACSPDEKRLIYGYGEKVSWSPAKNDWKMSIWEKTGISGDGFDKKFDFEYPYMLRDNCFAKWSPSSNYVALYTPSSGVWIVDLNNEAIIKQVDFNDGRNFRGDLQWHPTQDIYVIYTRKREKFGSNYETFNIRLELIDAKTGEALYQYEIDHSKGIRSISWSPDGRYIATGSADGSAIIWDLKTNTAKKLQGKNETVGVVVFSPDGQRLAIEGLEGNRQISIWDHKSLQEIETFPGYLSSYEAEKSTWHHGGQMIAYRLDSRTVEIRELKISNA